MHSTACGIDNNAAYYSTSNQQIPKASGYNLANSFPIRFQNNRVQHTWLMQNESVEGPPNEIVKTQEWCMGKTPRSGARVGVGMLRSAGDSLTWKSKVFLNSISQFSMCNFRCLFRFSNYISVSLHFFMFYDFVFKKVDTCLFALSNLKFPI